MVWSLFSSSFFSSSGRRDRMRKAVKANGGKIPLSYDYVIASEKTATTILDIENIHLAHVDDSIDGQKKSSEEEGGDGKKEESISQQEVTEIISTLLNDIPEKN